MYSVRSEALTKAQETSCPVLLRSFYTQEPRFETEAWGNSECDILRELVSRKMPRSPRLAHKAPVMQARSNPFDMFFEKQQRDLAGLHRQEFDVIL